MTDTPDPVDAFSLLSARPDDTPQVRLLRAAVIGMGVVLAVGFAAVVGRIFYLMTRAEPMASPSSPPAEALAVEASVILPTGAKVRQHGISGSMLSVLYEAPGGDGIIVIDTRTGRQISHIRLQPQQK